MEQPKRQKIVYVLTKGPDNTETALLPFIHAVGALATDIDAAIVLMANAVLLAQKDVARHIRFEGKPPLDELMKNFFELGGKLYLCSPCAKARGLTPETLVEQAEMVAAAVYNELLLEADATVSY
ncbi:MAG: DsrE family protein [Verrucomicrobia bacterium]|nr:DsrE family protein [Verrucomicrobiota bacterium]